MATRELDQEITHILGPQYFFSQPALVTIRRQPYYHSAVIMYYSLSRYFAVIFLFFEPWGICYREFAANIPNGFNVPHPCKPNVLWRGVGHFNAEGGGKRNPFGQDFDDAGMTWTKALCQKDSDGDGMTNGEELGDPNCTWTLNKVPQRTTNLSHPGVCDPLESPKCQQSNLTVDMYRTQAEWMAVSCKEEEFVCEGLNDTRLKNFTIRIPPTKVPARSTTYMCYVVQFPDNASDVHMIATTPNIDNRHVMHHIMMYGCPDDQKLTSEPFECGMFTGTNCTSVIGVWTLGQNGECSHPKAGVLLGARGHKRLAVEFHWNNPYLREDYTDSSGMTIYYTPNERPNNARMLAIGIIGFQIPPRQETYTIQSRCTSSTTSFLLLKPFYITSAWNHMHYLGYSQKVEHFRNGNLLHNITYDEFYSYDSPHIYSFTTPIEVLPGDELQTTCQYKSTNRLKTTVYGASTFEEMCFGVLTMYPADAWKVENGGCFSFRSFFYFDPSTRNRCSNIDVFLTNISSTQLYANITENCEFLGNCRVECKDAILEARKQEPCLTSGDAWEYVKENGLKTSESGRNFLGCMASCELEVYKDEMAAMTTSRPITISDTSTGATMTTTFSLALIFPIFVAVRM